MKGLNKLSLALILLLFSSCAKKERIFKRLQIPFLSEVKQEQVPKKYSAPNITIWVHGTCLWPFRVLRKYWADSPTLIKVSSMKPNYYLRKVAENLSASSLDYPIDNFYFLRWSGKLSVSEREETAQHLYEAIKGLLAEYKEKYETKPTITVITHSHGGNVALNLSKVKDRDPDVKVDNLVLLACPVQRHTREFVHDCMFENVYSFYSTLDFMQVLDPQGLHYHPELKCRKPKGEPLFSGRSFPKHSKLCNVKIKINGKGVWHTQFLSQEFISILPQLINNINSWREEQKECNYFISVFLKKNKVKNIKKIKKSKN